MVGVEFSTDRRTTMKNLLIASLVSFGFIGSASAQYYNGPHPINPPQFGGCVTGREGTCPTNRLPRVCPGFPSCPTNRLPRVKPDPTPAGVSGYSVF